ncbi:MAG: tyrosine-type recombinase/integrase [Deltaproteobacteria bacterium]|nr:tyrosine-type recombinase/integrase [Deltaproteobacteria bacterium]
MSSDDTSRRRRRGLGSLYQKRGVWYVSYWRDGKRFQESAGSTDLADAKRLLKKRLGEVQSGRFVGPSAERITVGDLFAELVNDYRVNGRKFLVDLERCRLSHLRTFFGNARARDVTTDRIRAYQTSRLAAGAAHGTINRELAALRRAFRLSVQAGRLDHAPHVPMLAERNVRTGFLDRADYAAVRAALPEPYRLIADLAYTYGWRKQEVLGLTWAQVDLDVGTVRLDPGSTKNGAGRTIVLTRALHETLSGVRTSRTLSLWVFCRLGGQRRRDIREAWAKATKEAGLEGILFHDLRRSAVRNIVRAGIPERVAMTMSGHKTRSIFDRYHVVSDTDLREAATRLEHAATGSRRVIPLTRTATLELPERAAQ